MGLEDSGISGQEWNAMPFAGTAAARSQKSWKEMAEIGGHGMDWTSHRSAAGGMRWMGWRSGSGIGSD